MGSLVLEIRLMPCLHPQPSNVAFCTECGEKNPYFDRKLYKQMHPSNKSYEDTLGDCFERHSATLEAARIIFECEDAPCYCPDCGTVLT